MYTPCIPHLCYCLLADIAAMAVLLYSLLQLDLCLPYMHRDTILHPNLCLTCCFISYFLKNQRRITTLLQLNPTTEITAAVFFCFMAIELNLIRMLHSLHSHLNLVRVADLDIILFHWVISNGVCGFQLHCPQLFSVVKSHLPPTTEHISKKTIATLLLSPLIRTLFLALGFTRTAMGDLLPSSDCIILSALRCE